MLLNPPVNVMSSSSSAMTLTFFEHVLLDQLQFSLVTVGYLMDACLLTFLIELYSKMEEQYFPLKQSDLQELTKSVFDTNHGLLYSWTSCTSNKLIKRIKGAQLNRERTGPCTCCKYRCVFYKTNV